ncbi:hypothetical protein Tco_0546741 [Tanacetum coccineum]
MSENKDQYHDAILDLEEKLKKNVDLFLKIGNSLQGQPCTRIGSSLALQSHGSHIANARRCFSPYGKPFNHALQPHYILLSSFAFSLNQIIVVNLNTSSDNNSDSYSTSQISTSEEIDYDSPEPPNSLLKWHHYLSDEYKDNVRFWGSKSGCAY